jgi:hypothetical protein
MRDAYGGFAKGMPKKLDKLPLIEPMKSFELRCINIHRMEVTWVSNQPHYPV